MGMQIISMFAFRLIGLRSGFFKFFDILGELIQFDVRNLHPAAEAFYLAIELFHADMHQVHHEQFHGDDHREYGQED
jgi:hypothetical protein